MLICFSHVEHAADALSTTPANSVNVVENRNLILQATEVTAAS
jgi:hypothetical protein